MNELLMIIHLILIGLVIAVLIISKGTSKFVHNGYGHGVVERVTAILGEIQITLMQIKEDNDLLHKRIEYLETRDRNRT